MVFVRRILHAQRHWYLFSRQGLGRAWAGPRQVTSYIDYRAMGRDRWSLAGEQRASDPVATENERAAASNDCNVGRERVPRPGAVCPAVSCGQWRPVKALRLTREWRRRKCSGTVAQSRKYLAKQSLLLSVARVRFSLRKGRDCGSTCLVATSGTAAAGSGHQPLEA